MTNTCTARKVARDAHFAAVAAGASSHQPQTRHRKRKKAPLATLRAASKYSDPDPVAPEAAPRAVRRIAAPTHTARRLALSLDANVMMKKHTVTSAKSLRPLWTPPPVAVRRVGARAPAKTAATAAERRVT